MTRAPLTITRGSVLGAAAVASTGPLLRALPLAEIKLGITTDEIDEDVTKAAESLARFGLHYAEVRSIWGRYGTAQPAEKVREAQGIFAAH